MGDEKKTTGAEAGPATETLVAGAPNSSAAQSVVSTNGLLLQTKGLSSQGAKQLLVGQPITNPADQILAQTMMSPTQAVFEPLARSKCGPKLCK